MPFEGSDSLKESSDSQQLEGNSLYNSVSSDMAESSMRYSNLPNTANALLPGIEIAEHTPQTDTNKTNPPNETDHNTESTENHENHTETSDQPGNVDIHNLPLGDGHVVTDPAELTPGNVLVSPEDKQRMDNAPPTGAIQNGPWINEETQTWDLTQKLQAPGEVYHDSEYSNTVNHENNTRTITGNAEPSTPTGEFPIDPNSPAGEIDPNPNHIEAQPYTLTIPSNPSPAESSNPLPQGATAILNTGAVLYSPLDASGKDAVAHEIQDSYDGHASEQQEYHVHNVPSQLYENQDKKGPSPVLGRALDGYPIVAAFKENGELYSTAELDENHGTMLWVEDEEGNVSYQWAYCVSLDYPYTMSSFKGTPSNMEYQS